MFLYFVSVITYNSCIIVQEVCLHHAALTAYSSWSNTLEGAALTASRCSVQWFACYHLGVHTLTSLVVAKLTSQGLALLVFVHSSECQYESAASLETARFCHFNAPKHPDCYPMSLREHLPVRPDVQHKCYAGHFCLHSMGTFVDGFAHQVAPVVCIYWWCSQHGRLPSSSATKQHRPAAGTVDSGI